MCCISAISQDVEDERLIAIIGYGAQRFGILVDGVDDAEEIVVNRSRRCCAARGFSPAARFSAMAAWC